MISSELSTIIKPVDWTDKDKWAWPSYDDHDKGLFAVFDWVRDLDVALKRVKYKNLCVQAGGACGVNPLYLSGRFDQVVTFEPDPVNWAALVENTKDVSNIKKTFGALSNKKGFCRIDREPMQIANCGAGYAVDCAEGAPYIALDDLDLQSCDFIQLDVEGSELAALQGAAKTIERCRPVIVIEETNFGRWPGVSKYRAREWLINQGYRCVTMAHNDAVMVPC